MSQEQINKMDAVTYFNNETGYWSFYGSVQDFDTQKDAYDAHLQEG